MNIVSRMVNLHSIATNMDYRLDFNQEELCAIKDHLDLEDLSNLDVTYKFSENSIFYKTYDVTIKISADYKLISQEQCSSSSNNEIMNSSSIFVTTLLDKNTTNISSTIMKDLDIELISNNQFDVADLAIQHLSIMLYM